MAKKRYVHKTVRPSNGGKLSKRAADATVDISNYANKLNFRRDLDSEIRREGWDLLPNAHEMGGDPLNTGAVRLLHEYTDHEGTARLVGARGGELFAYVPITGSSYLQSPSGATIVVSDTITINDTFGGGSGSPTTINKVDAVRELAITNGGSGYEYATLTISGTDFSAEAIVSNGEIVGYQILNGGENIAKNTEVQISNVEYVEANYFEESSSSEGWTVIASGLHHIDEDSDNIIRRWECVEVSGYVIFNNGYDLPLAYRSDWSKAESLRGLRENGIASVGTIQSYDGRLVCADIMEIDEGRDLLSASPQGEYGCVYDMPLHGTQIRTSRNQYSILWSAYGEPWLFNQSLSGSIEKDSNIFVLDGDQDTAANIATIKKGSTVYVSGAGVNADKLAIATSGNVAINGITGDIGSDVFTKENHGLSHGDKIRVTAIDSGRGPDVGEEYYVSLPDISPEDRFTLVTSNVRQAKATGEKNTGNIGITITDGGIGYASAPAVTISGVSGITNVVSVISAGGRVVGIEYDGEPTYSTTENLSITIAPPPTSVTVDIVRNIVGMSIIKPDLISEYEKVLEGATAQKDSIRITKHDGVSNGGDIPLPPAVANIDISVDATATRNIKVELKDGSSQVLAHNLESGEIVTIQGASDLDGIPAAEINGDHIVRYVDANTFEVRVQTQSGGTATTQTLATSSLIAYELATYTVIVDKESYSLDTTEDLSANPSAGEISFSLANLINESSEVVNAEASNNGLTLTAKTAGVAFKTTVSDDDAQGDIEVSTIVENSRGGATQQEIREAYAELHGEDSTEIPDEAFTLSKPVKVEAVNGPYELLYVASTILGVPNAVVSGKPFSVDTYYLEFIINKGTTAEKTVTHFFDFGKWFNTAEDPAQSVSSTNPSPSFVYNSFSSPDFRLLGSMFCDGLHESIRTSSSTSTYIESFAYESGVRSGTLSYLKNYITFEPKNEGDNIELNRIYKGDAIAYRFSGSAQGGGNPIEAVTLVGNLINNSFSQEPIGLGVNITLQSSTGAPTPATAPVTQPSVIKYVAQQINSLLDPYLSAFADTQSGILYLVPTGGSGFEVTEFSTNASGLTIEPEPQTATEFEPYEDPVNNIIEGADNIAPNYYLKTRDTGSWDLGIFYLSGDWILLIYDAQYNSIANPQWEYLPYYEDSFYLGNGFFKWKPRNWMKKQFRLNAHASTPNENAFISRSVQLGDAYVYDYDLGSGYQDWQEDGSAIIKMETMSDSLACYREGGYFTISQTGKVATPFTFRTRYIGKSVPSFRNSIINVQNRVHIYSGTHGIYKVSMAQPEPALSAELSYGTTFWEDVSYEESEKIFAAENPLTKEYFLCTLNNTICFDYINGTVSEMDAVLTAATATTAPNTSALPETNERVEQIFLMAHRISGSRYEGHPSFHGAGNFSGGGHIITRYGWMTPVGAGRPHRIYTRQVGENYYDYTSILESGLYSFGDTFNDKDLRTYILHASDIPSINDNYYGVGDVANIDNSPLVKLIVYTAYTSASSLTKRYPFGEDEDIQSIELTDLSDENTIPLYLRAPLFQDRIEVTGNAPFRYIGKTLEVAGIFDKSAHQVIGQGGFINASS